MSPTSCQTAPPRTGESRLLYRVTPPMQAGVTLIREFPRVLPHAEDRDSRGPEIECVQQRGGESSFARPCRRQHPMRVLVHSLALLGLLPCDRDASRHIRLRFFPYGNALWHSEINAPGMTSSASTSSAWALSAVRISADPRRIVASTGSSKYITFTMRR